MRPLFVVLLAVGLVGMVTLLAFNAASNHLLSMEGGGSGGGDMMDLSGGHPVKQNFKAAHAEDSPKKGGSDSGGRKHSNEDKDAGSASSGSGKKRKPADPMMSKMGNETLKAELGRSAWRLIHTMAGKFPYKPSEQQRETMLDFIYAFAQVYPCGECARHFKQVLEKHPPNVTDRDSLSQWACKVHNVVNDRLKKPIFDCSKVGDLYKCGCSEEEMDSIFAANKPTSIA